MLKINRKGEESRNSLHLSIHNQNYNKINWLDIKIWKKCLVTTFICLIGCSYGSMLTSYYLIDHNWFFILIGSIFVGFITSMILMIPWEILFNQMNFKESIKGCYKLCLVSMLIMILIETSIILLTNPIFSSSEQQHHTAVESFKIMIVTMGLGFLFSLPYNYIQLYKMTKHHLKASKKRN